jgi:hypothetical protein
VNPRPVPLHLCGAENGIEAEKRKQKEFFELGERFRNATDSEEARRLGDKFGRMVFSGTGRRLAIAHSQALQRDKGSLTVG